MTSPETEFGLLSEVPREELLGLSLHEITHRYEADGLRQRLLYQVENRRDYDDETTARIHDAVSLAMEIHEGQTRGEWTYATHILRVATRIISPEHFNVSDPAIIIAALLHDTVEDRPERLLAGSGAALSKDLPIEQRMDLRKAALAVIEQGFSSDVARHIATVTNPLYDKSGYSETENLAIYQKHVIDATAADPEARIIKLSDLIDNYCGIKYNEKPTKDKDRLATKYAPLVIEALTTWLNDSATPLSPVGRKYIRDSLKRGAQRHLADLRTRGENFPELENALNLVA